jgi:hypothetical protein
MSPIKFGSASRILLGATWIGIGVNFGVYSEHATAALCPFDSILHKIRGSESKTLFGVD